jgi:hypothetical protein
MATPRVAGERSTSPRAAAVSLGVLAALSVGGCAAASPAAPPTGPASSRTIVQGTAASCAGLTPSQRFAAAKVVFDGTMLSGATVPSANGILASPARVRVEHYLQGSGPAVVTVQTAIKNLRSRGTRVSEDGIRPRAGERWRIYASSASEPYSTSICLGSHLLPARTKGYASPGALSFDYPATWHARTYAMPPATFSTWLVWLSPEPMHPPCVTRHGTHNTTITCTDPLSRLRPDSSLAYWTSNGAPGWRFGQQHGIPITVGGRDGKWLAQTDTTQAPRLRETEIVTVVVPRPVGSDSWYQLTAFLRGPDTARLEAQIKAMLRSVHWLG